MPFYICLNKPGTACLFASGEYLYDWINPASGEILGSSWIKAATGNRKLETPSYSVDIALRIMRKE